MWEYFGRDSETVVAEFILCYISLYINLFFSATVVSEIVGVFFMSGLDIFVNEFLDYVLSLDIKKDCPINFGNLDFDYSVIFNGSDYILEIYSVALDHYGMPYRNVLEVECCDVSEYFGV